jgi:hypothetical protein
MESLLENSYSGSMTILLQQLAKTFESWRLGFTGLATLVLDFTELSLNVCKKNPFYGLSIYVLSLISLVMIQGGDFTRCTSSLSHGPHF